MLPRKAVSPGVFDARLRAFDTFRHAVSLFGYIGPFPRPGLELLRAPRAAAVKHGRRPPAQPARSVLCAGHAGSLGVKVPCAT
jgi:hypothetical protein